MTIIEMLVFISIFIVAMITVCGLLIYFYRTNSFIIQQSFAINSARKGIEFSTREIREATYSDSGAYPVISAQNQSFSLYSDVDKDNKIEKMRYFLDGTDFKKGMTEATGDPPVYYATDEIISVISDNVRNATERVFIYYNASSTEVSDLSQLTDIRMVSINLVINIDPTRAPENFSLMSSAQLRNLYEY